ncbi:MAG: MATE family efflux transporter [Bacteroides sp.]|nr:MATE family efflux transporter [Bacteroides sp.]
MTGQKIPTTLGTEKVGKLLLQYAIPAIIAMTASSLYNMVDSIFIGQGVGKLAISGLALTFPLMNLAAAFGSLVGVGAATLVSVKLGQRDYDTARNVLGNVVLLNILIGGIFSVITLLFLDPILYFFGASEFTIDYARDYMQIILLGNIVTHLYLGLNSILRSAGHPKKAMIATVFTVVLNTILDPIFIFWFDWGIKGAAIATILAQVLALLWLIKQFMNKEELIHLDKGIFKLKKRIVLDSLSIGMSPFLMNLAATFVVIFINQGLKKYGGDLAIGAYGIVNRMVFLFIMVVMGINQGMQPIAGYNFGARQYERVTKVLKLSIYAATGVTTLGFVLGMFFPELAASIFTSDEELIKLAADGMRIVVLVYPLIGFQIVTSNFFQSIGMARKAIFLSLTRQVLFLIPCLLILPQFFGVEGVWMSMPIADLAACAIAGVMLWQQFRKFKRGEVVNNL